MNKILKKINSIKGASAVLILFILIIIIQPVLYYIHNFQVSNASDKSRKYDLSMIAAEAEMYFQDNGRYPDGSEISIKHLDPIDGKTINGCKFGYIYNKIGDNRFKVSVCMELDKEGVKNDGGNDKLRYEVGNFK